MASRYKNIGLFKTESNTRFRRNPIYPDIPVSEEDFYIVSSVGERYDTLALRFYGDSKLWWIIASANRMTKASLVLEPGVQVRIPASKSEALRLYNEVNSNR